MIHPLGFYVLVRPDMPKEALKSTTIAIPETVSDKWRVEVDTGVLVAVGDFAWKGIDGTLGPWAKVGQHVVYAKYGGKILEDPETQEKLVLLHDKDIIGEIPNG